MKLIEERLALLPSLEETQKRFQDAGLEERLKEKSLLMREESILTTTEGRLERDEIWQNRGIPESAGI
jgi:hypothetical protein